MPEHMDAVLRAAPAVWHDAEVQRLIALLVSAQSDVQRLGELRERALRVARSGHHDASRWEHPIDVPRWVTALGIALDAPDDVCDCTSCAGAQERRARDQRAADFS